MKNVLKVLLGVTLAAHLAGCAKEKDAEEQVAESTVTQEGTREPAVATSTEPTGIAWFEGSVDEAFAAAREQDKPIFLYFGAEWCPYCKELQATVFRSSQFIELSRQFVSINLGTDSTDSIQEGDRFNVYGLPTVIVFDSAGEEITRIAGGIATEHYAAVLELTLDSIRPVAELVAKVQAGEQIEDNDWRLLGAYSWGQDKGQALGDQDIQQVLLELQQQCPGHLDLHCSRLVMASITVWAWDDERDPAAADGYALQVMAILEDDELARENLVMLAEVSGDLLSALTRDEDRAALAGQLQPRFEAALADQELDILTRGYALSGWVDTATAGLPESETLSAEQAAWVKKEADSQMQSLEPSQQHAGINNLWRVYRDAGMEEEARAALLHGIEVSRAPYYFMSSMGGLERKAGNNEAALDWYRRAWDAATGPTNRIRWGAGYLRRLLELTPEDVEGIAVASQALLTEAGGQARWMENYEWGFGMLSKSLMAWSESAEGAEGQRREAVLADLRSTMDKLCTDAGAASGSAPICTDFLAKTDTDEAPPA
jgi:thiol-disulfide isomerase/thioredoxin